MCKISLVCVFFVCSVLQASVQSFTSEDVEDVQTMASNLLELPQGTDIPPLILSLLRNLPKDVKAVLRDKPLYELSKEELATLPVPILYLLPSTQLYNLSGYQHGMLVRLRPDILSLADIVINSMDDTDVKITFLKALDYTRNLSSPVQDNMGGNIAGWKSMEIQFELMYSMGNPLAGHFPVKFMLTMGSRLKGEMMYYLRTWLWNDYPYRGANLIKWFGQPWSVRRTFTKMSVDDNYPANLTEWKYNHVEGFSHLIPTMTLEEFSQISLKEKYNYKKLLNAPLTVLQVRYLFNTMYPGETQLFAVEFQEYAHLLSSLQPAQLNRFYVNATDMIQSQYSAQNMTYATAKQIAEIIKVQNIWGTDSSEFKQREPKTSELSNLGTLIHTMPTAELGKLNAAQIDLSLLATVDSSKLSFPQAYELGHIKANLSLSSPTYKLLPQAIPAQSLADIEPKKFPSDDLLNLLRRYPGTQEAFSVTLMERLRYNLGIRHLEQLLLNPNKNKLLNYLPIPEDSSELYTMFSQLYQDPVYRPNIDQVDPALIRSIMPMRVSYQLYIKDRFLFKGVTCVQIININTYELVVFLQDYFDYLKQTQSMSTMLTKQTMRCLYGRLVNYIKLKPTLPLLNKMDDDVHEASKHNDIDQLTRHELRAFGNTVAMFDVEEIAESKHFDAIVEMMGKSPREHLDVLKPRGEYEAMLEKYLQKILNTSDVIEVEQILTMGNLTHYLPNNLIAKIDAKGFKYLLEAKLIDTRLCGNAAHRQQMGELIIRAFGHLSTWTSDILVTLQDFLLALSQDQLDMIPTTSWTDMADLIVTNYDAPTNDENGLTSPFHQICTSRLNKEDSQDYIKSLSAFVQFYLIQIQTHLTTVKSAKKIMASPMLPMDKPNKVMKPATIDDDEMTKFTILEPESSEDIYEDTSTSPSTTTTTTIAETTTEDKIVSTEYTKVNETTTSYWNIYSKPRSSSQEDLKESKTSRPTSHNETTVRMKEETLVPTMKSENNVKPSSGGIKDIEHDKEIDEVLASSEEDDGFDDEFKSSEEKLIESLEKSEEIIELEDLKLNTSDLEGTNAKLNPCSDGSCTPGYTMSENRFYYTSTQKSNDIQTVRIIITNTNATENENTESSAIVDQVMDFSSSEYKISEAENDITTTIPENNKTALENENTTLTPKRNIESQTKNVKENEFESEQNRDIVSSDLNKWKQTHENKEQNEVKPMTENARAKKETRLENVIPFEHITTTSMNTIAENTTLTPEEINKMISKLPSVPQEDPEHENDDREASDTTVRTKGNQSEDGYIIKPEDRDIMNRKIIQTEEMANEITFSEIVTSTPKNIEDSNRIPTEQHQTFTERTNHSKESENSFENESFNSGTTTTMINQHSLETSADNKQQESVEQSSNENGNSSTKFKSSSHETQRQNKLTDDLSNESNPDENRSHEYNENQNTYDEEPNYYPNNESTERNFEETLYEFSDINERKHDAYGTTVESNPRSSSEEENYSNLDQMENINAKKIEDSNTFVESSEIREMSTNTSSTNEYNEHNEMKEESVMEAENDSKNEENNTNEPTKNKYDHNVEYNENNKNKDDSVTKTPSDTEYNQINTESPPTINNFDNNENNENNRMNKEETTTPKNEHEESITNEPTAKFDYNNGEGNEYVEKKEIESEKETIINVENEEITTSKPTTTTNYGTNKNDNEDKENVDMEKEEITAQTTEMTHEYVNPDHSTHSYNYSNEDINEEMKLEEIEKESDTLSINQDEEIIISISEHTDAPDNGTNNGPEKVNFDEATTLETFIVARETTTQTSRNNENDTKNPLKEEEKQSFEKENDESNSDNKFHVNEYEKVTEELSRNLTEGTTSVNTIEKSEDVATTMENNEYELRNNKVLNQDEASVTLKTELTTHNLGITEKETILRTTTELGITKIITTEQVTTQLLHTTLSIIYAMPQSIKLKNLDTYANEMNISHDKVAFRRNEDDQFDVYVPDDSKSVTLSDSSETPDVDLKSNRVVVNTPEFRDRRYDAKERVLQLTAEMQSLDADLKLYAIDYTDEAITPKIKSRKRRFVYNSDAHIPPTEMNITCEALSILGTITNIVSIEDFIVKLNKDNLLDCIDLIHKMKVSQRAKEAIINKYYKNINEVLPILGNIIADLTLEEMRGIEMTVWSLEILEHANTINDTQKAQLLLEKYMKYRSTKVLNLNELVLLKNMLCYIPEGILKNSLSNLKPSQLTSILKHIDTCSAKCLDKFSTITIKTLGTPMSWKYDQVYNLGTVPSGLNETLWNEFVQHAHLKFNMNAKNFKCFNDKQAAMIQNAVQIEQKAKMNNHQEVESTLEVLQDPSSGTKKISRSIIIFISLFASYFVKSLSC